MPLRYAGFHEEPSPCLYLCLCSDLGLANNENNNEIMIPLFLDSCDTGMSGVFFLRSPHEHERFG